MIKYKLWLLNTETVKTIPSSTLHNWRSRDLTEVFGLPDINDPEFQISF